MLVLVKHYFTPNSKSKAHFERQWFERQLFGDIIKIGLIHFILALGICWPAKKSDAPLLSA